MNRRSFLKVIFVGLGVFLISVISLSVLEKPKGSQTNIQGGKITIHGLDMNGERVTEIVTLPFDGSIVKTKHKYKEIF